MAKKALLMILDGWGIGDKSKGDVIYQTPTPYMDYLNANYPHSQLQASGENVGLPDGQMGNSEVGHLNIGAGRIVYPDSGISMRVISSIRHLFLSEMGEPSPHFSFIIFHLSFSGAHFLLHRHPLREELPEPILVGTKGFLSPMGDAAHSV